MRYECLRYRELTVNMVISVNFLLSHSGPGCSKLTTSFVNVSLKFQMLISEICRFTLLKKCEKLFLFFQQKISVYLVIKP